jgi:ribosomal protein L40E
MSSDSNPCRNCEAENRPDAKFCGQCGQALSVLCRSCGVLVSAVDKFCRECGRELIEQAEAAETSSGDAFEEERRQVTVEASAYPLSNNTMDSYPASWGMGSSRYSDIP